ncbi:hypothetical protein V6N12_046323 [Hibiscus sabdariffa]|uniref:Uncharacterized protein n=1 Tax=Hibiscus sabdariffa TaxID=183260 RepID=A0ABR2AJW0_9ROSI
MIELQDKAFTAKEKKSRDRAIKRSKRTGKEMAILKVNGLFSHTLVFDKKFKLPEHQLTGFEDLRNNGNSFEVASCLRSLKILELNEFDCVISFDLSRPSPMEFLWKVVYEEGDCSSSCKLHIASFQLFIV